MKFSKFFTVSDLPDDEEDIATSSRQKILEDDDRYLALKEFIRKELKHIQSRWTSLRNREGTQTS